MVCVWVRDIGVEMPLPLDNGGNKTLMLAALKTARACQVDQNHRGGGWALCRRKSGPAAGVSALIGPLLQLRPNTLFPAESATRAGPPGQNMTFGGTARAYWIPRMPRGEKYVATSPGEPDLFDKSRHAVKRAKGPQPAVRCKGAGRDRVRGYTWTLFALAEGRGFEARRLPPLAPVCHANITLHMLVAHAPEEGRHFIALDCD